MQITITFENTAPAANAGPVSVGWLRDPPRAGVVFDPPERVMLRPPNKAHAKTAGRCPAVINLESRYFMVRCPFDMHIGFTRDKAGRGMLVNRAGAASPVRAAKLADAVVLVNEAEWRFPDRPTVQLKLPYVFIADEPVFMSQLDAFAHYRRDPLPGTIFGGRFPIHVWPRPIMWGFEWHDTARDLILRRGEPLFYLSFEGVGPERPIQMVEATRTPDLAEYMEHISGAVSYVNRTFALFARAEGERPARLLVPRDRG